MSLPLLKITLRKNWILALIFTLVLLLYSGVMISMYNPDDIEKLMQMFALFPPEVMKAFGFAGTFTDMTGYLASWLYGLLMIGFPMVYSILLANRLMAKPVDSGSISCLLALPISRNTIVFTKAFYAVASLVCMLAFVFGFNVFLGKALYPQDLNVEAFLRLNITVTLVNLVVLAISFFFCCLFNDAKYAMAWGAGIPIAFLLLHMLGGVSEKLEPLKKCSIFGWYTPLDVVAGESTLAVNLVYLGILAVLFCACLAVFRRRRLPV